MTHSSGRHFLQLPGPSNVPDRVLEAMRRPTIDHRGPEFQELAEGLLRDLRRVFRTDGRVILYPSSATGAWEAAVVNTLSPGDRVLAFDRGEFASRWVGVAERHGIEAEVVPGDWRRAVEPAEVEDRLRADEDRDVRAVLLVHNETSTGVVADVEGVREAMDRAGHPALLMVDAVSSLGCMEYRHDPWGVDVTVAGSQKGLMLPPGLGLVAVGDRALGAAEGSGSPRSYWDWGRMIEANRDGVFPYTPATNLLFGLREAVDMLLEEGLESVWARHRRLADAARAAVEAWDLEIYARRPEERSDAVTAVRVPGGSDAEEVRRVARERFDTSLGKGLGPLTGDVFRIGHLGDFNEPMLGGTLFAVELSLEAAGIPHTPGGLAAAMDRLR